MIQIPTFCENREYESKKKKKIEIEYESKKIVIKMNEQISF